MAASMLQGWASPLRELVDTADPDSVSYFRFNAADPDAELTPWPSGPVTALGDAVHVMPPTGGRGASTAIRDAGLLTRALSAAAEGHSTLGLAVHHFERGMAGYAPQAVRASLAPLIWQRRLRGPLVYHVARTVLPVAQGLRCRGTSRDRSSSRRRRP
ncbi:MAG TPA: FAD-dependent monooxygenase [Pseudonocardiaceae bacterium]|nr:FAD-dependent monooxygenase [Pseudonocardiaceae bacterium]